MMMKPVVATAFAAFAALLATAAPAVIAQQFVTGTPTAVWQGNLCTTITADFVDLETKQLVPGWFWAVPVSRYAAPDGSLDTQDSFLGEVLQSQMLLTAYLHTLKVTTVINVPNLPGSTLFCARPKLPSPEPPCLNEDGSPGVVTNKICYIFMPRIVNTQLGDGTPPLP